MNGSTYWTSLHQDQNILTGPLRGAPSRKFLASLQLQAETSLSCCDVKSFSCGWRNRKQVLIFSQLMLLLLSLQSQTSRPVHLLSLCQLVSGGSFPGRSAAPSPRQLPDFRPLRLEEEGRQQEQINLTVTVESRCQWFFCSVPWLHIHGSGFLGLQLRSWEGWGGVSSKLPCIWASICGP